MIEFWIDVIKDEMQTELIPQLAATLGRDLTDAEQTAVRSERSILLLEALARAEIRCSADQAAMLLDGW